MRSAHFSFVTPEMNQNWTRSEPEVNRKWTGSESEVNRKYTGRSDLKVILKAFLISHIRKKGANFWILGSSTIPPKLKTVESSLPTCRKLTLFITLVTITTVYTHIRVGSLGFHLENFFRWKCIFLLLHCCRSNKLYFTVCTPKIDTRPRNMLLLKNPHFLPNFFETWSKWPSH